MTIEIAEDWFDNNISDQQGFTLDDENKVYTGWVAFKLSTVENLK